MHPAPSPGLPPGYHDLPLIRSYAKVGPGGTLQRVEVRGYETGLKCQVTTPMPTKLRGPDTRRTVRDLEE